MFNKITYINKLISLIIMFIILLLLYKTTTMFLPALLLLFVAFVSDKTINILISLAFFFVSFILINNVYLVIAYKILLFLFFIVVLESMLNCDERRYIYGYLRNFKLIDTERMINRCYKDDLMNTIEFDNSLIYKYAMDGAEKRRYKLYLKEESAKKLKQESNYKYIIDRIRYGNYHDKQKEIIVKSVWTNEDNIYLAVFIFGFILSMIFRG